MKGPLGRTKFSALRWWACPRCQCRQRTSGQVVNLACTSAECVAAGAAVWMQIVEPSPAPPRRLPPVPQDRASEPEAAP